MPLNLKHIFQSKYYACWVTQKVLLNSKASPNGWGKNNYKDFNKASISMLFILFLTLSMCLFPRSSFILSFAVALGFPSLRGPIPIQTLTLAWILNLNLVHTWQEKKVLRRALKSNTCFGSHFPAPFKLQL